MPQTDIPVLSVSEISLSLKACIEQVFACVRVRGEVSGVKKAPSGHIYFSLKDSDAVLSAVAWRGRSAQTAAAITEGLEIICSGKLSTYPGRSNYQMIVETAEPAGIGALLKLLNERKEKLTKEGLFDPARKKNLPYLPDVIGVITSPTGAVIRDIMHRLKDRFGRHVLLWPVLVQGEEAPAQITAAIQGFNKIPSEGLHTPDGIIPRPDVLIVARGGGSLEDLWGFNEECVVRAAAESQIPLISAVGHETDTTLIDYAADRRAPTPTAAAEMAVPVQYELISRLNNLKHRQDEAVLKYISDKQKQIALLARSVPNLSEAVNGYIQKLDDRCIRLKMAVSHYLNTAENKFNTLKSLLKSYSYTCVLERGFALVTDAKGKVVSSATVCITQPTLTIAFQDGAVQTTPIPSHNTLKKNKKSDELSPHQGDLFHDK